jgi:hypothetical protein
MDGTCSTQNSDEKYKENVSWKIQMKEFVVQT